MTRPVLFVFAAPESRRGARSRGRLEFLYIFRCDATEEQFIYTGYFVEGRRRAIQWARYHGASYLYVRP
jgi:arginyl-tRNA--protein-N-Asp/Glu arginylyltransferase